MDFGIRLRQTRESKGISLREIASVTKISVSALEALERNDLDRLPGGIFTRSFVRAYASEIGLDPDQAVKEFLSQFPNQGNAPELDQHAEGSDAAAAAEAREGSGLLMWLLVGGISLAALLVYLWTGGRLSAVNEGSSTAADATTGASPAPADAPSSPPAAPSAATPLVPGNPVATEGASADVLSIVLAPRAPCWLAVTVDGERRFGRVVQPGEREELQVRDEMVVIVGDAGALNFTINGAPGRSMGTGGQVVELRINKGNYKSYLATP